VIPDSTSNDENGGAIMKRRGTCSFEEKILVRRQVQDCFDYLVDLTNLQEWNPAVISVKKTSKGPPAVNSEYVLKFQLGLMEIPLQARLTKVDDGQKIIFIAENQFLQLEDHIDFSQEGEMAGIHYRSQLKLNGYLERMTPAMQFLFRRSAKNSITRLEKALGEQPEYIPPTPLEQIADRMILPALAKFSRFGYQLEHRDWAPYAGTLKHKNALVLMGSGSISRVTAMSLARLGARVIAVGADEQQGEALVRDIAEETGQSIIFEKSDLAEVSQAMDVAHRVYQHCNELHLLINCTDQVINKRIVTKDGLERTLAQHLIGPFVFVESVFSLLKQAGESRLISMAAPSIYTQRLHLDDLQFKQKPYNGTVAYARAKRGVVDLTEVWSEKWRHDGVIAHSMNPGWADDQEHHARSMTQRLMKPLLRTPEQAADTIIWLATSPSVTETSGLFWLDRRPHPTAVIGGTKTPPRQQKRLYETLHGFWDRLTQKETGT
jgi:NAD(P)-dependent dehydrogenase (short-subunit alcohol dehydrogenase family)